MSCPEPCLLSGGTNKLHSYGIRMDGYHVPKRLSSAHITMKTMERS